MSNGKTPKNILVNSLGTSLCERSRSITLLASQGKDPVFTEVNVLSSSNDSGSSYFPSTVGVGLIRTRHLAQLLAPRHAYAV
jgi:hypothetical protein